MLRVVEEAGVIFPPHPGDEGAHVGGLVACNAGGTRAVKYGVIRNFVRGLEVVLPTGEIVNMGGKLLKHTPLGSLRSEPASKSIQRKGISGNQPDQEPSFANRHCSTTSSKCLSSNGLRKKSNAPSARSSLASSSDILPDTIITGMLGSISWMSGRT